MADQRRDPNGDKPISLDPQPPFVGTPANVDIHNLGEGDRPQQDWGESEPGALHGQTHTNRPVKSEAERGQGPKTRLRNKDIVKGK